MKSYHNVVIVYPEDSSTKFLYPIVEVLLRLLPEAKLFCPAVDTYGDSITDNTDLVIFLGHGSPSKLYGSVATNGEKSTFLNVANGEFVLGCTSVILFSCNSWEYLRKFRVRANIHTYLAFGDMPTDWDHINHNRELEPTFLSEFAEDHLEFYKSTLVDVLIDGFQAGYKWDSLIAIPQQISRSISKKISDVIHRDSWSVCQKLQLIQLLVNFRREIKYAQSLIQ